MKKKFLASVRLVLPLKRLESLSRGKKIVGKLATENQSETFLNNMAAKLRKREIFLTTGRGFVGKMMHRIRDRTKIWSYSHFSNFAIHRV